MSLAEEDDTREKCFDEISEARVVWSGHARVAIKKALADIRTYHFDPERAALLPSKKGVSSSEASKAAVSLGN